MGFRVGLTYNVKSEFVLKPDDPPDLNAEFDHEETVQHIEKALKDAGHEVVHIGHARRLLERMNRLKVDIVFNIAEGYEGRNRESQVPILLEMMRVPYVGADGLTLGLTLDKVMTKKVLIAEGIPTPRYVEVSPVPRLESRGLGGVPYGEPPPFLPAPFQLVGMGPASTGGASPWYGVSDPERLWQVDLTFPLIVKLRYEGSSKGLSDRSLVNTPEELRAQVQWLSETYHRPSIFIEEFIEGEEFTVAIIGNEAPEVYPVCQIALDGQTDLGRKFFTFAYLRSGSDYVCPAPIAVPLAKRMQDLALRTYQAVDCRDFGRVDFRVDRRGNPYVLEINPLPSLSTEDVFNFIAKTRGMTHYQIVSRILDAALERTGLKPHDEARSLSATRSH